MGTIRTTGKASKEVEYDKMTITMAFNTRDRRSKDAIRKVTEECEQFLEELEKIGIDIKEIRGGKNDVSKNSYRDNKEMEAVRTIKWDSDYSLRMIDAVMKLSENGSYDVDISVDPRYSRNAELCRELLQKATVDAKEMADLLAGSLGKKIKGPSKINASRDYDYITNEVYMESERYSRVCEGVGYGLGGFGGVYSTLKNPTMIHEEEITIEWELED